MSKKYRGKTCAYCATPGSSTGPDHVLAREFCLKSKRANLPQVPACDACNHEKSELEHYVTAVAPFGARHADSRESMSPLAGRLANNRKLAAHLLAGLQPTFESTDGITWQESRSVPFDARKLMRLYEFMAKGLAFRHWGVLLPAPSHLVEATFVVSAAAPLLDRLFMTQRVRDRVHVDLSDGVLVYDGIQDLDHSEFTAWRLSLYGAVLGADRGERPSRAYVITAPRTMLAAVQFIEMLRRTDAPPAAA